MKFDDLLADEAKAASSAVSFDQLVDDEDKYDRPLAAGLASAAKGATFSLSDQFLTKTGLVKPETLAGLEEYNPVASTVGEVGGVLGSLLIPGGGLVGGASKVGMAVERGAAKLLPEATTLGAKVLQGVSTKGLGGAAEATFYGTGQALHEDALGDPNVNAEKVLSHIGFASVIGGGVGGFFGLIAPFLKGKAPGATPSASVADDVIKSNAPGAKPSSPLTTSLDDMAAKVQEGSAAGLEPGVLPQKSILESANNVIPDSKFPVHNVQLESMADPNIREIYKSVKESNTVEGKILRDYESLQKTEGVKMLDDTIRKLSPEQLTADAYKGGEQIGDALSEIYKAAKIADKEVFETIKRVSPNLKVTSAELLESLQKTFPDSDFGNIMQLKDGGDLVMKPWKSSMPISKEAYTAVREVVEGLDGYTMSVEGLRNVRNSIGDRITFDLAPRPKAELSSIKKNLMDLMEGTLQKEESALPVRDAFRNYARNEARRETLEKIIGGKLDDKQGILRQFKPEQLGDKMFSNSATIQAIREIVPIEVFDRMAGNYLLEQVAKFTDQGKFSSQRFATWAKNNATELNMAFGDKAGFVERLNALADKMRILPDTAPLNPSGTAKALNLSQALDKISSIAASGGRLLKDPLNLPGNFLENLSERMVAKSNVRQLEAVLAGGAKAEANAKKMGVIERMVNTANKNIDTLSSRLLETGKDVGRTIKKAAPPVTTQQMLKDMEKIKKDVTEKTGSPDQYVDTVSKATEDFHDVTPNIASGVQVTMTAAAEFVKEKLPDTNPIGPLSPPRVPSTAELYKFFRYYDVVENPLTIMSQVKNGTLTSESMEAMQVVYPRLLAELRIATFDKLAGRKDGGVGLPYQTKMMLSAFLGKDLVPSVTQESLMQNQQTFGQESQQADAKEMAMAQKSSQSGKSPITIAQRSNSYTRSVIDRRNA